MQGFINWVCVSMYLSGLKTTIGKNAYPKKYEKKVEQLLWYVEKQKKFNNLGAKEAEQHKKKMKKLIVSIIILLTINNVNAGEPKKEAVKYNTPENYTIVIQESNTGLFKEYKSGETFELEVGKYYFINLRNNNSGMVELMEKEIGEKNLKSISF